MAIGAVKGTFNINHLISCHNYTWIPPWNRVHILIRILFWTLFKELWRRYVQITNVVLTKLTLRPKVIIRTDTLETRLGDWGVAFECRVDQKLHCLVFPEHHDFVRGFLSPTFVDQMRKLDRFANL